MKALLALVFCAAAVTAHVCLITPAQRGGAMNLFNSGDPRCKLLNGPCGGFTPEFPPMISYHAGENVTFVFQKNVDHYRPGVGSEFVISFSAQSEPNLNLTEIMRIPDTDAPAMSIYSTYLVMPPLFAQRGVLQVVYDPKNGDVFYACADVLVLECEVGDKDCYAKQLPAHQSKPHRRHKKKHQL